jgi:hypothetical protein
MASDENNFFKVKLKSTLPGGSLVTFNVTPDVIENRNVNYKTMEPIHMPGGIHVYGNTASRTYNINNIRLISRTSEEATKNLWAINVLRHWTTPYFGKSTISERQKFNREASTGNVRVSEEQTRVNGDALGLDVGRELIGAPPDVLFLSAYSESSGRGNIYKIPVVITNLSIPYPSDIDYIPTQKGSEVGHRYRHIDENVPFPTVMTIDINCIETHSPKEYSNFNIYAYRNGKLDNF